MLKQAVHRGENEAGGFFNILLQREEEVKIVHVSPGRTRHNMGIELFEERIGVVFLERPEEI
jgi:hypothetical protein